MCYNLYWMKAMQGARQIQTCVFFILCVSVCACAAFLFWSRSLYYDHVLWYVLILFSRESYVAVREESKTKSRLTETERWAVCSHICPLTLTSPIHPALLTSILSCLHFSPSHSLICLFLHFIPLLPPSSPLLFICCHSPPSLLPSHVQAIVLVSSTLIDPPTSPLCL